MNNFKPVKGQIRFDTTKNILQIFKGSKWGWVDISNTRTIRKCYE